MKSLQSAPLDLRPVRVTLLGSLLAAALLLSPAAANAYWIRPFAAVIGSTIDGLDVDGAKFDQQGFTDAAQEVVAEVDLLNGSVGGLSRIGQLGVPVVGAAPTASALFGETVTFNTDILWEPSITFDGFIETGSPGAPSSAFYVLNLTVFEGHTFGGPNDWFPNRGSALIDD